MKSKFLNPTLNTIIRQIQTALSPELLNPKWRKLVQPGDHPTTGHCYICAEALYHAWGKERGFKPVVIPLGEGKTHWFLKNPKTGEIADPSKEQFEDESIPYDKGVWCGFLTGDKPSKRCRELLNRIGIRGA